MTLRLAFAKGRATPSCIQLVNSDALPIPESFQSGSISVFYSIEEDVECFLVRGRDMPWLLDRGYIDAAVGSNIHFEEYYGFDLIEAASLDYGQCRLSLITPDNTPTETLRRICTRFPRTTSRRLAGISPDAELIELAGCNEVSLFMGFADAIVDIVETGRTIQELALLEREVLCSINHAIWIKRDRIDVPGKLQHLMPSVSWNYGTLRV